MAQGMVVYLKLHNHALRYLILLHSNLDHCCVTMKVGFFCSAVQFEFIYFNILPVAFRTILGNLLHLISESYKAESR